MTSSLIADMAAAVTTAVEPLLSDMVFRVRGDQIGDGWSGYSYEWTEHPCRGWIEGMDVELLRAASTSWSATSVTINITSGSLAVTPAVGDQVVAVGVTYEVKALLPEPTGAVRRVVAERFGG